ncbi:hypothetical protein SUGI_0829590 [Cryptomeria japonica]|nr:hypothetical protein SUGI_0829590 [Cryptomeria japonica]
MGFPLKETSVFAILSLISHRGTKIVVLGNGRFSFHVSKLLHCEHQFSCKLNFTLKSLTSGSQGSLLAVFYLLPQPTQAIHPYKLNMAVFYQYCTLVILSTGLCSDPKPV